MGRPASSLDAPMRVDDPPAAGRPGASLGVPDPLGPARAVVLALVLGLVLWFGIVLLTWWAW